MFHATTSQCAAIEAMKNGDTSVEMMVKEYNQRRRVLVDGFRKLGLDLLLNHLERFMSPLVSSQPAYLLMSFVRSYY